MAWIAAGGRGSATGHMLWIGAAALLGFLVSFCSVHLGSFPRDRFVLVHAAITGALVASYARWAGLNAAEFRRHWPQGLVLAFVAAAFSVNFVLSQPASPGPDGLDGVLAVLWLGVVYGLIDALLLTVLPVHAVWGMARPRAGGAIGPGGPQRPCWRWGRAF
jgi:hypothetical protein